MTKLCNGVYSTPFPEDQDHMIYKVQGSTHIAYVPDEGSPIVWNNNSRRLKIVRGEDGDVYVPVTTRNGLLRFYSVNKDLKDFPELFTMSQVRPVPAKLTEIADRIYHVEEAFTDYYLIASKTDNTKFLEKRFPTIEAAEKVKLKYEIRSRKLSKINIEDLELEGEAVVDEEALDELLDPQEYEQLLETHKMHRSKAFKGSTRTGYLRSTDTYLKLDSDVEQVIKKELAEEYILPRVLAD